MYEAHPQKLIKEVWAHLYKFQSTECTLNLQNDDIHMQVPCCRKMQKPHVRTLSEMPVGTTRVPPQPLEFRKPQMLTRSKECLILGTGKWRNSCILKILPKKQGLLMRTSELAPTKFIEEEKIFCTTFFVVRWLLRLY